MAPVIRSEDGARQANIWGEFGKVIADDGLKTNSVLRVLLVEDSNLLSDRLREMINELTGVETIATVVSESEAIQAISEHRPHALVLDLRLKEGTGFGVMRFLNTLPDRPDVVVITNYALPQYRQQAQLLGVRYFLDKSQEFDQLPAVLEKLRDGRAPTN